MQLPIIKMAGVRSQLIDFLGLSESKVVANFDEKGVLVSYTILDKTNNQPMLIMEPAEFQAYREADLATRGHYLLAPQWSLDIGSSIIYSSIGNTPRAQEHFYYVMSSPDYWIGIGLGVAGVIGTEANVARSTIASKAEVQAIKLDGLPSGSQGVVNLSTGEIKVLMPSGQLVSPSAGVQQLGQFTPPANLVPGTTLFGDAAHLEVANLLEAKYPGVPFTFRVQPGATGVDVSVPTDYVGRVGFEHAEIKPLSPSGIRAYGTQVRNWKLDPATVKPIYYDSKGNVYLGK